MIRTPFRSRKGVFYEGPPFDCLCGPDRVYWRKKERMIGMSRRIVAALGVVLLLFSLSLGADAVEGSIRIDLRGGGSPISGAQIRVYCVGIPISGGFRLTDAFGGGIITELEVLSPELAVWLSQRASGGWKETTDREGSATFRGLGEGLYLVTQTDSRGGYLPFAPFLITVPWDGVQWVSWLRPRPSGRSPSSPIPPIRGSWTEV